MSKTPPSGNQQQNPLDKLLARADELGYEERKGPPPLPSGSPSPHHGSGRRQNLGYLDVGRYLEHYGYAYKTKQEGAATFFILMDGCLFDSGHRRGEAAIVQDPNPPYLIYHCFHTSCKNKTWKDARRAISGEDNIRQFFVGQDDGWRAPRPAKKENWQSGQVVPLAGSENQAKAAVQAAGKAAPPVPHPEEMDPWAFFEVKGKRTVFSEMLMAKYLVGYFENIVCTSGAFWHYESGLWQPITRGKIANIIVRALKGETKSNRIDGSMKVLASTVNRDEKEWPIKIESINCLSGMVDISTGELKPHDPSYGSRSQVPCRYDPDAPVDRWLKFLDEIFPGEEEKATVLQEFFGYCLLTDCRFEKACFLSGTGANGKGTVLHVLREMIGHENTCGLSLTELSRPFTIYRLQSKLVNIATETSARDPLAMETFKIIVSGEALEGEKKYGDKFSFNPYAKMIVAFNDIPVIPDRSHGFNRRVILLQFNQRFEGERLDPNLKKKLEVEKDGVFFWALLGLERLLERDGFKMEGRVAEDGESFKTALNPILLYVQECLEFGPDLNVEATELYRHYKEWCKEGGNRALARNRFVEQILMNFPTVARRPYGKNRRIHFIGVGIKD